MKTLLDATPTPIETVIAESFDFKGTTKTPVIPAISAYRTDNLYIVDELTQKEILVTDSQIIVALEKVGIFDRKGAFLATGQLSKNIQLKTGGVSSVPVVKEQQTPDDAAIILKILKESMDYPMLDKLLAEQPAIAKKLEKKYFGYFITVTESTDLSTQLDKPISSIAAPRLIDESGYLQEVIKLLPACVSDSGHVQLKAHEEPLKISTIFTSLGYTIASRTKKGDGVYQLAIWKEVENGSAASAEKATLESLDGFTIRDITAPSIDSFTDKKKVIATGEYTVASK